VEIIQPLSDLVLKNYADSGRRMSVCVVSSEFIGPVKNTGIATITSALAGRLVADGHDVTLLYTYVGYGKPVTGDKPWLHWVKLLAAEGVRLEHIHHQGDHRAWREASWLVKDFVGQGNFDLVYFNDYLGSGYYSLLAKRAGVAPYCNQLHCIITHGSTEWVFNHNGFYAERIADVEVMGLERRSIEMADVVIGPSLYLLNEYESYGWTLPKHTYHQPYPIYSNPITTNNQERVPIKELVFFGRLEVRKGLWLFCEALDRLSACFPRTNVTFLGRATDFSGMPSSLQIVNRSARWPFRVRLLTDLDQDQALSYLRERGRLAVMPSLADNSPCVLYECMETQIPFVSTLGTGAQELVDPNCWDEVMVQPNVQSLTEKLAQILQHGARLGRPRFDTVENLATWTAWHRFAAGPGGTELLQKNSSQSLTVPSSFIRQVKPVLIVVIDNATCTLSLLNDNLSSHIKRFGGRAAYLLLSTRRGEMQNALFESISCIFDRSTAAVTALGPSELAQIRQMILASEIAFFVDAETEILTSFFISAFELLQKKRQAIVSCATAVRNRAVEIGEIEELPTGDIPGLAALGEPIGGAAWAVSASSCEQELSSMELYDAQLDAFAASQELGQLVMQQCRAKSIPTYLLPVVGAVETREQEVARPVGLNAAHHLAAALGISASAYKGGACWFAMSCFGPQAESAGSI
jgi:glycosyltransferase involved in cell wall biosynthesis